MEVINYGRSLNNALGDAMANDSRVVVMGEDIGAAGGPFGVTRGLLDKFGSDRVIDTPISEAAIVGADSKWATRLGSYKLVTACPPKGCSWLRGTHILRT